MKLDPITTYNIIVYLFGIMILVSFIIIIFCKNSNEYFKKIIGWLCILVFALVTKDKTITLVSVFIWWLLIATEKFLLHLASIFKTKSDNITSILENYNWENNSQISKINSKNYKEILEEKIKKDEKILENKEEEVKNNKNGTCSMKNRIALQQNIKKFWFNLLKSMYDFKSKNLVLKEKYKICNKNWIFIPDAIITDTKDRIQLWIEIKYTRETSIPLKLIIRKFLEQIRFYKFNFPFLLLIVSDNFDHKEINTIIQNESEDLKIIFATYDEKSGTIAPINIINIDNIINLFKEWDNVAHTLFGNGYILEMRKHLAVVRFTDPKIGIRKIDCKYLNKLS